MVAFRLERQQTLREQIVHAIRDAIISGDLRPNEKVTEMDLAKKFDISRTPIREAFHQLESEGFLTLIPRRGAVVTPITERDVREFYGIKSVLEGYATRLAVENITEEEIAQMERLNGEMERMHQVGDHRTIHDLHNQFHDVFLRASGNDKLFELTRNLNLKFQRFRIALSFSGIMDESLEEHKQIIAAMRARDADAAEAYVRLNATTGCEKLLQLLANQARQDEARGIIHLDRTALTRKDAGESAS